MLKRLLVCSLFFAHLYVVGQNTPAFRQFYFNQYLFNPAFAGIDGYTKASILYRKQWQGFNNAPSAAGFTLEYPTKNKASFGINFLSHEIVALRTSSIQTTFAYRIPLSVNQFLFFGLSGGVGSTKLNISDADYSNDPTILAAADASFYAHANFGAVYQLAGLRVGFSLPKLINQNYFGSLANESSSYAQLRNQLYSLSYKIQAGSFSIEPYALYRLNQDFQDWWEAATILYFKEKVWIGGSYHNTQGAGFFLGADIKEKFRFGYSYELPPLDNKFINASSHEVHIQIRLGKKRVFKWAAKYSKPDEGESIAITQTETEPSPDTLIIQSLPKEEPKEVVEEEKIEPIIEPTQEVKVQEDTLIETTPLVKPKPPVQPTLATGLYLVAGSFRSIENARAHQQKLLKLGNKEVQFGLNKKNGLYYVYVFSSYDLEECKEAVKEYQLKEATREVWILRIQ
jgi:type IX secretion system PorP/SprF family membrane protein